MFWLYEKYQTAVVVIKCKVLQCSSFNLFFFTLPFNAMHVTSVARIFFLSITACRNLFLDKFPLQEYFFGKSHPPPPPAISNGPSLKVIPSKKKL